MPGVTHPHSAPPERSLPRRRHCRAEEADRETVAPARRRAGRRARGPSVGGPGGWRRRDAFPLSERSASPHDANALLPAHQRMELDRKVRVACEVRELRSTLPLREPEVEHTRNVARRDLERDFPDLFEASFDARRDHAGSSGCGVSIQNSVAIHSSMEKRIKLRRARSAATHTSSCRLPSSRKQGESSR